MHTIPIDFKYKFLLYLNLLVLMFDNYELTFSVWVISALFTLNYRYSVYFFKFSLIFFLILLIAILSTINKDYKISWVFRDYAYMVKPIVGLMIGYQIFKKIKSGFLETLVYVGFAISISHLLIILYNAIDLNTLSYYIIRDYAGYHNDYEVFTLILLLFHKKFNLNFTDKQIKFFTIIVAISSILYFSRINFIQFFVLLFALKGYLVINKRNLKIITSFILFIGIGYYAIYQYNPKRTDKGIDSLLFKIKNIPNEAFKTKININDYKDFNDNFRSYENLMTLQQVTSDGVIAIIFGKGMGSTIDYGRRMHTTDGGYIRQAPQLHNGYATIFLKSGIIGLLLLFYSIYFLSKKIKTKDHFLYNINNLFFGISIYLILSYWVFTGFYLKLDNKIIFVGYLIAYREFVFSKIKI